MRRSPFDEGMRWLEQANEDLRWTQDLAERGGYHIACFLGKIDNYVRNLYRAREVV